MSDQSWVSVIYLIKANTNDTTILFRIDTLSSQLWVQSRIPGVGPGRRLQCLFYNRNTVA
jgi:hypothetical protein